MTDTKAPTQSAFALKREGKKYGRRLEIGYARRDGDGVIHGFTDRTPVGRFNGYIRPTPSRRSDQRLPTKKKSS